MIPARKRLIKGPNFYRSRRSHNGLLDSGQDCADSRLMLVGKWLQWQPGVSSAVAALVHDVLHAGNAEFRDDLVRGPQQNLLQLARLFPLALTEELVEGRAFLWQRAC